MYCTDLNDFYFVLGTVRRFIEKNMEAFDVVVFVVEPIDEVREVIFLSGPVHNAPCRYDPFLLHRCYPFTLLRFCTKTEGKTSVISVLIDLPDNKYGAKDICFVSSHCSGSVKLFERFQNPPFLYVLIDSERFQKPPFCGYPLTIAFSKTSVFVAFLCRSM